MKPLIHLDSPRSLQQPPLWMTLLRGKLFFQWSFLVEIIAFLPPTTTRVRFKDPTACNTMLTDQNIHSLRRVCADIGQHPSARHARLSYPSRQFFSQFELFEPHECHIAQPYHRSIYVEWFDLCHPRRKRVAGCGVDHWKWCDHFPQSAVSTWILY